VQLAEPAIVHLADLLLHGETAFNIADLDPFVYFGFEQVLVPGDLRGQLLLH
jgi:hypothetical protein